ncbi:MAG: hypothetical protein U9Q06_04120 [Nanoarchaeota archaeon]|nr:hypothetical protein [Nanoarchaeota archaeon]
MKYKIINVIQIIMMIFVISFGLFIAYQIILKLFGHSWSSENLIISLLMANIGLTFVLTINQVKTSARLYYFENQFRCLAKDFKQYITNK